MRNHGRFFLLVLSLYAVFLPVYAVSLLPLDSPLYFGQNL